MVCETNIKIMKDVLCRSNVRWSWVGQELRAGADGVGNVGSCASSDVREGADKLLVHLGVVKVGNGWAVALGELNVWCPTS